MMIANTTDIASQAPRNEGRAITSIVTAFAFFLGYGYLLFNLYSLNRGFNLWDEAYYLLSYKMAAEGFYPHFTNTPFLIASLFEWLSLGIIGYKIIHLILNILGSGIFALAVIRYLQGNGVSIVKGFRLLLVSLAFAGTMYVYAISVATLSYNHINEFLILLSLSLFLMAFSSAGKDNHRSCLLVLSGAILAVDIYIKPPTCLSVLLTECVFLSFFLRNIKASLHCMAFILGGCIASFGLSLLLFYPPAQWIEYLAFVGSNEAHAPLKLLAAFSGSALDMLRTCYGVMISGLLLCAVAVFRKQAKTRLVSLLLLTNTWFAAQFFFSPDLWASFNHPWLVYSSTTLLLTTVLNLGLALAVCTRDGWRAHQPIVLLLLLLAVTPIVMSVGTLNGFVQVQMHAVSWLLLSGIAYTLCLNLPARLARAYSALLITVFMVVGVFYFYHQIMPQPASGYRANNESTQSLYSLEAIPLLHDMLVDKPTYDLLTQTKTILDKYPGYPTLVFFDMPGLQYAFGRRLAVLEPWLSNYEHPLTKDNVYNCKMITRHPEKLKNTIFIVARAMHIDNELAECLAKVGFPDELKLIGTVYYKGAAKKEDEPIRFYLHL